MSVESPDMCVVKECLLGAGLYEELMEKNEMMRYYNFIKSSGVTADEHKKQQQREAEKEDLDRIDVVESPPPISSTPKESRFTPKSWSTSRKKLGLVDLTNNNNKETPKTDEEKDISKSSDDELNSTVTLQPKGEFSSKELLLRENLKRKQTYDKLNSIDVYSCEMKSFLKLKSVVKKPKFSGPIYCQERIRILSVHDKVKEITEYHNLLAEAQYKLQRKSLKFVELPGWIQPSQSFSGDLERKKSTELDSLNLDTTYTSRSGRAVKRKMYAEGASSDDDDFVTTASNKEDPIKSLKKTKPAVDEDFDIEKSKVETPKVQKRYKSNLKKVSNEEIMNRSSLFSNSPAGSKNRSNQLFDKLKEDQSKAKKAEMERKRFEESLDKIDVDDDDDNCDLKITSSQSLVPTAPMGGTDSGETVTKLRVVPPMAGRKGYKRTQSLVPVQEVRKQDNGVTSSPPNKITALSDEVELVQRYTNGNKKEVKKKLQACPICNREFPRKDIEDHASTCGLTSELEIENDLPTTTVKNNGEIIRCEICNHLLPLTTSYEVHVKDCIQEHS